MISFSYDKKLDILKAISRGIISLSEIKEHYRQIKQNDFYPRSLKVLIDCRDTKFTVQPEDTKFIIKALGSALQGYEYIYEAILVEQPFETVIAILFEQNVGFNNYDFKIFSTEKAALNWLSLV